jgi:hypothetical protein
LPDAETAMSTGPPWIEPGCKVDSALDQKSQHNPRQESLPILKRQRRLGRLLEPELPLV